MLCDGVRDPGLQVRGGTDLQWDLAVAHVGGDVTDLRGVPLNPDVLDDADAVAETFGHTCRQRIGDTRNARGLPGVDRVTAHWPRRVAKGRRTAMREPVLGSGDVHADHPSSRNAITRSATSGPRSDCRIAHSRAFTSMSRSVSNPSSTASTACDMPTLRPSTTRGEAHFGIHHPSSARSSAHSAATLRIASSVCMTARVCSNVSRYRTRDPLSAASTNH